MAGSSPVPDVPESMAQDDDRRCTGSFVRWREIASEDWALIDQLENIRADLGFEIPFRKAVLVAERNRAAAAGCHSGERLRLSTPILKIRVGNPIAIPSRVSKVLGPQIQEPIVPDSRESFEKHCVCDGKHRRIHADPDRQHRHGRNGEARILPPHPQRIADVPQPIVKPSPAPRVVCALAYLKRWPQRTLRRRAIARVARFHVEVEPQFFVEIAIER